MTGTLYLIPSPIGNLDDVSIRVKETLNFVDVIFCEDTRNTNKLLTLLNIKKPLISAHEHNERSISLKMVEYLKENINVGYMSDAGYPGISDPGEILTKEAIKNNFKVVPLSGASAFLNALVASSLSTKHFLFYGFLDAKSSKRIEELKELRLFKNTIIFYEAPHRINDTLKDLYEVFGNRKITIARELTKIHEEFIYTDLKSITSSNPSFKGELVLVLEGNNEENELNEEEIIQKYNELIENGLNKKDAINALNILLNIKKNLLKKLFY